MMGLRMLYEDATKTIHIGIGAWVTRNDYLVWTLCGKDIPAKGAFKSSEHPTCEKCIAHEQEQPK